jgi:hypothetical protein
VYLKIQELSALSLAEYINIVGHYNKITLKKEIDPRLLQRGFTQEQLKAVRDSMEKLPSEIISLNLHFKTNLEKFRSEEFNYLVTLYDAYHRHGVLPYSGSLSEQPNKIIEIFNVLDSLRQERENKLLDEHKRNQENKKKRNNG